MAISPKDIYPSQVDTTDPTGYPYGKAQNVSSPGDGSGTPLEKDWLSDWFGFQQAALDADGATPSGAPDKVGASQVLTAILGEARRSYASLNWKIHQPEATFSGSGDYMRDVAFAPDFYYAGTGYLDTIVAVGDDGGLYYTPDAHLWGTLAPAGGYSGDLNGVAWLAGLSLWCVVGDNGEVQTSPDIVSWTKRALPGSPTSNLQKVVWNSDLGLAVIVGQNGGIWTSTNGTSWTQRTAGGGYSGEFLGIAWSSSLALFVAVGDSAEIQTSPDGVTWTSRANTAESWIRGVTWSPKLGLFAIASDDGFDGKILTSPDGITWTERAITQSTSAIHWSDSLKAFISDGAGASLEARGYYVSKDGFSWTLHQRNMSNVRGFADARGFVVAAGKFGRVYLSGSV